MAQPIDPSNKNGPRIELGETFLGTDVNYTKFDSDGTMVANGLATTYEDLLGDITSIKTLGTGVTLNTTESTLDYSNVANLNDYAIINFQISHAWKLGSTVYPHIHFEQNQNAMPNWLIQYRWQREGQPKTTAWTNYKVNVGAFTYTSGTLNQISFDSGLIPPAGYGISDILEIRVIRDTANASGVFAGLDPYTGTASITAIDVHIECDTLGSRTEYTK